MPGPVSFTGPSFHVLQADLETLVLFARPPYFFPPPPSPFFIRTLLPFAQRILGGFKNLNQSPLCSPILLKRSLFFQTAMAPLPCSPALRDNSPI